MRLPMKNNEFQHQAIYDAQSLNKYSTDHRHENCYWYLIKYVQILKHSSLKTDK